MQRLNYYTKLILLSNKYYLPFYIFKKSKSLVKYSNYNFNFKLYNNFFYKTLGKIFNEENYNNNFFFENFYEKKNLQNDQYNRFLNFYLFLQNERFFLIFKDNDMKFLVLKNYFNLKNNFKTFVKLQIFNFNNFFYNKILENIQNKIILNCIYKINLF
jgi:hypothetical protein